MSAPSEEELAWPAGAPPAETVLTVDGLTITYGGARRLVRAVTDVSLSLHRGEIYGIAGESGSGKSTLLNAICRLLKYPAVVEAGAIHFVDRDGTRRDILSLEGEEMRRFRWARIAMVFQSALNALNPVLTIEAQLQDVLLDHRDDLGKIERHERCAEVLRLVGVPVQRLKSYPHQLSGGTRQRVMIAMALILEPDVVLMDEPTTALDVVTQRQILRELLRLRDALGFAVVFITHDLSLLLEIADRITVMYGGRFVETSSPVDLLWRPAHPYSAGLIDSFPSLTGARRELTGVPGSPPDPANLPAGCNFAPRCRFSFAECTHVVPPLLSIASSSSGPREVACLLRNGNGIDYPDAPPAASGELHD